MTRLSTIYECLILVQDLLYKLSKQLVSAVRLQRELSRREKTQL